MSEALACIQFLAENAPAWIRSLDDLQSRMQSCQRDVARVAVPPARSLKKTSSNESIRHSGPDTNSPSTGLELTSAPHVFDSQQTTVTTEQIVTPCRKRKTLSLLSAASGIHKYRSRSSITVYYDSEVQDVFDQLVRNISTGRNNIRKSRMADRIMAMANMHNNANQDRSLSQNRPPILRTVRSASGMPRFNAYIEDNIRLPGGLGGLRPPLVTQSNAEVKSDIAVKRTDAREEADAALDKAQALCEKGAHQFLRDGDCAEEISGARAAFQSVIIISTQELERLKKEAAAMKSIEAAIPPREEGTRFDKDNIELGQVETEQGHQQRSSVSQNPALMEAAAGIIEADDDNGSEDEYDDPSLLPSPPFRLMART